MRYTTRIAAGIFITMALVHCPDGLIPGSEGGRSHDEKQRDYELGNKLARLHFFFLPRRRTVITDQRDGTVLMNVVLHSIANPEGGPPVLGVRLRKCPQGFLHNAGSNDCTLDPALGGSDPALAKLQFCSADTNACNGGDGILNGSGASEAHVSCAAETAAGLNWRPAHAYALRELMRWAQFSSVFPDLNGRFVWVNNSFDSSRAYARSNTGGLEADYKSRKHFVLCEHVAVGVYPAAPLESHRDTQHEKNLR